MDRHDRLRARLGGTCCTVCGAILDPQRMRVLAERDDLAFLELPCGGCGARTLGMITGALDGPGMLDVDQPGEPVGPAGGDAAPPLTFEDVRAMRRFLAGYRGDLRGLLDASAGPDVGRGSAR